MNHQSPHNQPTNTTALRRDVQRYGFQGQEEDQEMWEGAVSYKYRVEDARLGRFFSVDPLLKKYAHWAPYSFSGNQVINTSELEGLEPVSDVNEYAKQIDNKSGNTNDNSDANKTFQKITTINGRLTQYQSSDSHQLEKIENSTSNSESNKGFGLYMPQFTGNISANAGVSADIGPINASFNAGGVIVAGLDDNNLYFSGDNKSDNFGREVNKGFSLGVPTAGTKGATLLTSKPLSRFGELFISTGFEYKQIRNGTLSGEIVAEKYTAKMIGFIYTETTHDHRTGTTSSVTGLSIDYGIGVGLIFNAGIKLPLYKQ